ncbi:MAG: cytochrome P460 family protein [Myxococcales bacterium]|nr:cytochrome P460 family protein [Myxococcales bacterium]
MRSSSLFVVVALSGCGSSPPRPAEPAMDPQLTSMMKSTDMPMDDGATFGPLAVGADYAAYVHMNTAPVPSETHGGRLVDTYVNAVGAAAYLDDEAEIPVGTVVVKTSVETKDGAATGEAGPIFVMEKKAPGFDPEHGDWAYAIHWAEPPARWAAKLGGPIYWRSPSHKVGYCVECHDNYDRNLGGVPGPARITALPE